jgi:hypothetical protein
MGRGSFAMPRMVALVSNWRVMLPSPHPWDFPSSIDGDICREDNLMELDDPELW